MASPNQQALVRSLSPELMLEDAELAERARTLLREPDEADGKGNYMSALGTHEIIAGAGAGLEPPLSPPVVGGPMASALPAGDGLAGLPTPPPAIRPPESANAAPAPAAPLASVEPAPEADPAAAAESDEPVLDYFAAGAPKHAQPLAAVTEEPTAESVEPAPAAEDAAAPEVDSTPLMAPAPAPAPAEAPVDLPTMAPAEVEPELTPAAVAAPVELAPVAPVPAEAEPSALAQATAPEVVAEPAAQVGPALEQLEELFAAPATGTGFRVVVRLKDGDGVEVGSFRDFGTAMEGAQEVVEQFANATNGQWPFYAGRFIRPDLIVSVDVAEGDDGVA